MSTDNKAEIMKKRASLWRDDVFMSDNLTERQIEVQKLIDRVVDEERRENNDQEVRSGLLNIYKDGVWYQWNEYEGELEEEKKLKGG